VSLFHITRTVAVLGSHGEQKLGAGMEGKHSRQALHSHHPHPQGLVHPQQYSLLAEGPLSVSWEKVLLANHEPQNELLLVHLDKKTRIVRQPVQSS
jgi:hypothetical protein